MGEYPSKLTRDWMKTAERIVDKNNQQELYVQILDHLGFTSSKIGTHRLWAIATGVFSTKYVKVTPRRH